MNSEKYFLIAFKNGKKKVVKIGERDIKNYVAQPKKLAVLKAFESGMIASELFTVEELKGEWS